MSFEIERTYEVEELGILLNLWAQYSSSGGGSDEPAYGPTCEDITAIIADDNDANDNDIWEGLADIYIAKMSNNLVWVQGSNGWHIENAHTNMRADMASITHLQRKLGPASSEIDGWNRQRVYQLVNLQSVIQEYMDEQASEAEDDGAGKPDPDEAFDAARDDEMMEGK